MAQLKKLYDSKLMVLCKQGHLYDGLNLVNEMMHKNIELSHCTLSALLNGCISSKQYSKYEDIWNKCISEYHIKPNSISYLQAICAASYCQDIEQVKKLLIEMKANCNKATIDKEMKQIHWNQLIHSLATINSIDLMLNEYNNMRYHFHLNGDNYTMSILLNTLIRCMIQYLKFPVISLYIIIMIDI